VWIGRVKVWYLAPILALKNQLTGVESSFSISAWPDGWKLRAPVRAAPLRAPNFCSAARLFNDCARLILYKIINNHKFYQSIMVKNQSKYQ
jgi:hypothetical protein